MHEWDLVVDRHSGECPWADVCNVSAELGPLTEATAKQLRFAEREVLTTLKTDDRMH